MPRTKQRGGAGSDFRGLFHSTTARPLGPMSLTRHTLKNINGAPMFHPLDPHAKFPTGSSGVIPTGTYYAHVGGARPKRTPTPKQLAALARGRAVRAANIAKRKTN